VSRSLGIATANSAGTGSAQATIGNVNDGVSLVRFTKGSVAFGGLNWSLTPAHPGDTLVLWGTGGGADPANDTGGTSGDQTAAGNFVVNVGGRQVTPLYAGASSGYPGLWQVNFTLPSDITTGCFITAQVSAAGELSNAVMIPIAPSGQNVCPDNMLNEAALARLDAGGTIASGGIAVAKINSTFTFISTPGASPTTTVTDQETISGGFSSFTATQFAAAYGVQKIGACTISDFSVTAGRSPATPQAFLDAGPSLPVNGPKLAAGAALAKVTGPSYLLAPANGTITGGGRYAVTGPGGADIGPFTASVTFPSTLTVTNWSAITSIDRTKPLTINWTGGDDQIYIFVNSIRSLGNQVSRSVTITCQVPAPPGTYTVPTAALAYLLPTSLEANASSGSGSITVEAVNSVQFTAPRTSGGSVDFAGMTGVLAISKNLVIQ
jgi:hypothetical protein